MHSRIKMNLSGKIKDTTLKPIAEKVEQGIPVDRYDAMIMLTTNNVLELGIIANHMRRSLHGDKVYYGVNMNLNYTNICELRCPLCAFSRDQGEADAYLLSLDEIEKRVTAGVSEGIDEVHIVGGLYKDLKLDFFEEMVRRIKAIKPDLFIVAFTATEYDYFARLNMLDLTTVFRRLMDAGVDAMPGGGAEVFAPAVRNIIAPKKISGVRWLEVMATAHELGLKTNSTMLYNHLETNEDIIDHLFQLRDLQDRTDGFKAFVPLVFHEKNTRIKAKHQETTGFDDIRIFATSRIVLHNIPHIKALWMYLGEKMAQLLMSFGADEIGATYRDEKVVHAAGAQTADYGSESFLKRLITDAGMTPMRTTAGYGEVR
jgi:aminodeoxyfutalosine synthase